MASTRPLLDRSTAGQGTPHPAACCFDVPVADASSRRGAATDRIEDRGLEFQEAVRRGLARYAELAGELVVRVDGTGSEDAVAERVWTEVEALLG